MQRSAAQCGNSTSRKAKLRFGLVETNPRSSHPSIQRFRWGGTRRSNFLPANQPITWQQSATGSPYFNVKLKFKTSVGVEKERRIKVIFHHIWCFQTCCSLGIFMTTQTSPGWTEKEAIFQRRVQSRRELCLNLQKDQTSW